MTPSDIHGIGSSSNQLATPTSHNSGLSPNDPIASCIFTTISCFISNNSKCWLIDYGENEHICSSKDIFEPFYCIWPIKTYLPNNHSVQVHYVGNVQFPLVYISLIFIFTWVEAKYFFCI